MNRIQKTAFGWGRLLLSGVSVFMMVSGPALAQTGGDPFGLWVADDLDPVTAEAERFQADLPRYVASYREVCPRRSRPQLRRTDEPQLCSMRD